MSLAQLLQAHGDPVKVAAALGQPVRVAAPAPSVASVPLVSPTLAPSSPVSLNVDRIAQTPSAPAIAPASAPVANITAANLPTLPKSATSWLDWVAKHWKWLVAALIVLLVLAYLTRGGKRESGFSPSLKGKRIGHNTGHAKGSDAMREHMARLRAMRKRKG